MGWPLRGDGGGELGWHLEKLAVITLPEAQILEKFADVMSSQDSVLAECFTSDMKGILYLWKSTWGW